MPPDPQTEPPKVLHLIPNLQTGGAEVMLVELQTRLQQQGRCRPLICAMKRGGTLVPLLEERRLPYLILGIPRHSIFNVPLFVWDVIRTLLAIRRVVHAHHIHIVQSHLPDADVFAVLVGRLTGRPAILTHQSSRITPANRRPGVRLGLRHLLLRLVYRYADACIAVSPAVRETLRTQAGVPGHKIVMIYNSVDIPGKGSAAARATARHTLGASDDRVVIICTARLVENKGQRFLIDALEHIPPDCPPIHVFFVGDGEDRDGLSAAAKDIPARHRVTFLGFRRDVHALLAGADLFCLPSMWEGLPVSLLEALAREIPVVATRAPGIVDTVTAGEHALLVPLRDAKALADAIASLVRDQPLAARLATAGRRLVEERYSLDAAVEQTAHLYHRIQRAV